jgi:hypothetical protein
MEHEVALGSGRGSPDVGRAGTTGRPVAAAPLSCEDAHLAALIGKEAG